MGGFHPAAARIDPYVAIQQALNRIGQRIRRVEARPPSGMVTATRIDTPPPQTSADTETGLWRLPAAPAGTYRLLGIASSLTGTATGTVTVWDENGIMLDRFDAPCTVDAGPYPPDAGLLTVTAQRTGGTGAVVVDVIGGRYGPVLIDDTQSDDGSGDDTQTALG